MKLSINPASDDPEPKLPEGSARKPEFLSTDWVVGILHGPREENYLNRTWKSLEDAGWENPIIFSDGVEYDWSKQTRRDEPLGAFGNFCCALMELFMRCPRDGNILLIQDDVVFCRNTREYLESIVFPTHASHAKIYIPSIAEDELRKTRDLDEKARGFHELRGPVSSYGAQAYVFTHQQAMALLLSYPLLYHRHNNSRGHKNIDGAVYRTTANRNKHEYVHVPSLCQHIGQTSSLGHEWQRQSTSTTFPGEKFDAMELLI